MTGTEDSLKNKLSTLFHHAPDPVMIKDLLPLYRHYRHLEGQKVMVLFSGGLDTSFITHFLTHIVGAHVVTFSADVGSVTAPANMNEIAERSREVGAITHATTNCRDKLAELGITAIMAEAQLGNGHGHHPASSLSRVAICDAAVAYAKQHHITAVFHGSNGSQNNPYRFHSGLKYFQRLHGYNIEECTPNLSDTQVARDRQQQYLKNANIHLKEKAFEDNVSHDRNLLGDEWEEARIANPKNTFDLREVALRKIPIHTTPMHIALRFKEGIPVAMKWGNGDFKPMKPREILEKLNEFGLPYHIGIVDYPEGRPNNIRAREIHIQPAMAILIHSRNWLRAHQLDTETNFSLNLLSQHWAHEVMEKNNWTHPKCRKMDEAFQAFSKDINGDVSLDLELGKITNMTSPTAARHMEGTYRPSTRAEIEQYYSSGTTVKKQMSPHVKKLTQLLGQLQSGTVTR